MKYFRTILLSLIPWLGACSYLDVVPDNIMTLEMAFNTRANARKYLQVCYNYVPVIYNADYNAAVMGADDVCAYSMGVDGINAFVEAWSLTGGTQNSYNPVFNYWSGHERNNMFRGVHECNIFLENIGRVPDMSPEEKSRWRAEALTLKAYYLYWAMLHYGPIPLLKENASITADINRITQYREKIDDVTAYIVELLDEAVAEQPGLPAYITATETEAGRITLAGALAVKAKVLVTAASDLFNGNTDYADFLDPRDGEPFFDQTHRVQKWQDAAEACLEAVTEAEKYHALYTFDDRVKFDLTDRTQLDLTLRNIITSRTSPENLFAPGQTPAQQIWWYQPHLTQQHLSTRAEQHKSNIVPSLNVVEEFYTADGIPLEEAKNTTPAAQYEFVKAPADRPAFFLPNYPTIRMHLDREPRFYADIGFDGGKWFNEECDSPESAYGIDMKNGGTAGQSTTYSSATGYLVKKVCSYRNQNTASANVTYTFPNIHIRLADLYLLTSEALNESMETPDARVYAYIQKVRHRAGLDPNRTLQQTWQLYSRNPSKPLTQEGMREIIHRERLIELMFEGWRLHDLRRWKKADEYLNRQIRGFSILGKTPDRFYVQNTVNSRIWSTRDYLWPLKQADIQKNPKLVQNPLW